MSYQQAMYDREHPRYSEPTEYIMMEVDGLIWANDRFFTVDNAATELEKAGW